MGKFLTGKARVQQTDRKRIWKLLDNELYKADDGKIYLAPRSMYSDFYTIPSWIAVVAGSPVDYDASGAHIHDILCYAHNSLLINLTEEELKEKGYLRYSEKVGMWVCEDVPAVYLTKEKVSKCKANNTLYECMRAAGESWLSCITVRIGTACNARWYINEWLDNVLELDFNRVYDEEYWRGFVGTKLSTLLYNFVKNLKFVKWILNLLFG